MDKKEEERADLERQRMRRLMVEGIIGQEALQEDGYLNSRGRTSISPSWKGTSHSNKKVSFPLSACHIAAFGFWTQ